MTSTRGNTSTLPRTPAKAAARVLENGAAGNRGAARPAPHAAAPRGLSFDETMAGPFAMGLTDPEAAARAGRRTGWRCALHASVTIPDVDAFAQDPTHPGVLRGEFELPGCRSRIPFTGGTFQLFSPSPNPGESLMRYEAGFTHGGRRYYFAGRKEVHSDLLGLDLWPDTTTLYARLHGGGGTDAPVLGAGILRLGVADLGRLLASSRAVHAAGPVDAAAAYLRFGRVFAAGLADAYVRRPFRWGRRP